MTLPEIRLIVVQPADASLERLKFALADLHRGLDIAAVATHEEALECLKGEPRDVLLLRARSVEAAREITKSFARDCPNLPSVVVLDALEGFGAPGCADADSLSRVALGRIGARDVVRLEADGQTGGGVLASIVAHLFENHRLVRELEKARQLGLHLAHHDTLTGLPNRQLFRTRLRELLARARRHPRPLAVFFLDLDRFKQVNDTLGHNLGDLLLIEVARRIKSCLRETDLVARRGGDEFTVILDGVQNGHAAARVAEKILDKLAEPLLLDGHRLRIHASIGISLSPADGREVEDLVKCADIAMYRAKAKGGGFEFYLTEMGQRTSQWLDLENDLRRAIDDREFVLHYQPIVNVESGSISAFEALVRWQHPRRGLIFPDEFIGIAEESGLIAPLGDVVLREACRQNKEWQDEGLKIVPIAVNFSAKQFQTGDPVGRVREVLEETNLSPDYLDIELTESAIMRDPAFATETLLQMRKLGLRIAIDDFGTGHSSLAYLKRFPITKLKIDKAFVQALLRDPKDAAICRAIISMAHNLQLKAVAEGVEEARQLEFLRRPGCDEVQGYLIARPQDAVATERLLAGESPLIREPLAQA
jgi:diguanylate cyclase (GGDEF)-like protein